MFKLRNVLLLSLLILLAACGSKMSDEVYEVISEDFTDEMVMYILESDDLQFDQEYEAFVLGKLEEVSQKHQFSADDYLKKAKEKGEGWEEITGRIEERIMQFLELFWEQMEQDSLNVEE